ncbi:MAG: DUF5103 domain-containing protein [Bacteroidales bacterium]|nr:DUF5103 domain-containing protein [Bacteroidales bacterium]
MYTLRPSFLMVLSLFLALTGRLTAQDATDYYDPGHLRFTDYVYVTNIRTVLLHRAGWELSSPAIALGSSEKLLLGFDDLDSGRKDYRYTFIHCDAAWRPSELLPSDYIEGFYEDYITEYHASYNTLQRYTHYALEFPTPDMLPVLSGNYLLKIWEEGRQDKPVLTRRFIVFENLVSIQGRVHAATDIAERDFRQEVDFSIDLVGYEMDQPFRNLHIVLQQNGRWDNAITGLKPRMVKGNLLDFDHDHGNVFDGLNEFRHVDIKSLRYATENVLQILEDDTSYTMVLRPDLRRPFQVYSLDRDINGRAYIKVNEGTDSRVEAEYVKVEFTLPYDAPLLNGNLYILGALTSWEAHPSGRMGWDPRRKAYRATLYLKQGFYNYWYAFLEDGNAFADASLVEGSHEETENDYTILAYYRETGARYDRLIGYTQLNSLINR